MEDGENVLYADDLQGTVPSSYSNNISILLSSNVFVSPTSALNREPVFQDIDRAWQHVYRIYTGNRLLLLNQIGYECIYIFIYLFI